MHAGRVRKRHDWHLWLPSSVAANIKNGVPYTQVALPHAGPSVLAPGMAAPYAQQVPQMPFMAAPSAAHQQLHAQQQMQMQQQMAVAAAYHQQQQHLQQQQGGGAGGGGGQGAPSSHERKKAMPRASSNPHLSHLATHEAGGTACANDYLYPSSPTSASSQPATLQQPGMLPDSMADEPTSSSTPSKGRKGQGAASSKADDGAQTAGNAPNGKKDKAGASKHKKDKEAAAAREAREPARTKSASPRVKGGEPPAFSKPNVSTAPESPASAPAPEATVAEVVQAAAPGPAADAVPASAPSPAVVRRAADVRLPRPAPVNVSPPSARQQGAPSDSRDGRARTTSTTPTEASTRSASSSTSPLLAASSEPTVCAAAGSAAVGSSSSHSSNGGSSNNSSNGGSSSNSSSSSSRGASSGASEAKSHTSSVGGEDDLGEWEQLPPEMLLMDDGFGWEQLPITSENGWETAEVDKRRSKRGARRAAGDDTVHLKNVSGEAPLGKGAGGSVHSAFGLPASLSGSEEGRVTVVEEDWSSTSAFSAEDGQPRGSGASSPHLVSLSASSSNVSSRAAAPQPRKGQGAKGGKGSTSSSGSASGAAEGGRKARSGLKEVSDAGAVELQDGSSRVARAVAAIDLDVIASGLAFAFCKAGSGLRMTAGALSRRTPRAQAFLLAHGTEARVQIVFAALAAMLLLLLPTARLPPAVADVSLSRWVEVPLGVLLSFRLVRGDWMWSLFSPTYAAGAQATRNA